MSTFTKPSFGVFTGLLLGLAWLLEWTGEWFSDSAAGLRGGVTLYLRRRVRRVQAQREQEKTAAA